MLEQLEGRQLLAGDLFISEYIESSGGNTKVIELYNNSGAPLDVSAYSVELYSNGSSSATQTFTFQSGTIIATDDVFVIANAGSDAGVLIEADVTSNITFFNGDDAVALLENGVVVDLVGVIGVDPGTEWADDGVSTSNQTLRREGTIVEGNPAGFADITRLSTEWFTAGINVFSGVGSHTLGGPSGPAESSFVLINEILFDTAGFDTPNEYVELRGDAGTAVPAGTYLLDIEGDTDSGFGPGKVSNIFDLSGLQFGTGGYIAITQGGNTYTVDAGANEFESTNSTFGGLTFFSSDVAANELENATNTFLLVSATTAPLLANDIDANNDGTIDGVGLNWTILDSVAVLDDLGSTGDRVYSNIVFNAFDQPTPPLGYVARIGNSTGMTQADWVGAELTGSAPTFTLATGATSPAGLAGETTDHLGADNPDLVVPPAGGPLVINEVLADPDATLGDANGDGTVETGQDEFVELVNTSAASVDISGWTINDGFGLRHTFAAGTNVGPGEAIVVFGGGTPTGSFGGAAAVTSSTGSLGLTNGGDTVTLADAGGVVIAAYSYTGEGGNNNSLTRSPDLTGSFVQHNTTLGMALFSPGTRTDGTPFVVSSGPAVVVTQSGGTTELTEGGATDTIDVVLNEEPTASVTITIATDAQSSANFTSLTFTPVNWNTVQTVTLTAANDEDIEGPHTSTITLTPSGAAEYAALSPTTVTASITDNDFGATGGSFVINELRISAPNPGDNTNNFVEFFETTELANASMAGLTLVVLTGESQVVAEGATPAFTSGDLNFAFDLSSGVVDGQGFVLLNNIGSGYFNDPGDIATADRFDFFGSPSTFLLVEGFTGTTGTDLDADDDGILDSPLPWTSVIDSVSLADDDGNAEPARNYAAAFGGSVVTLSGGNSPAALSRRPDGSGDFELSADASGTINTFDNFSGDTPGSSNAPSFTIVQSGGSTGVIEGVGSDSFTVVLTRQPTDPVTITLAAVGDEIAFSTPTTLTFNPSGAGAWNVPQTVTVTGVIDTDVEGLHTDAIEFTVTSPDLGFDGLGIPPVTVTVADDVVAAPTLKINEVRISDPGALDNTSNFIEVVDTGFASGVDLTGLTLVAISEGNSTGLIDFVLPLDGGFTDPDGFALAYSIGTATAIDAGDVGFAGLDLVGAPTTFLLVSGFTGAAGADLDADNNRVLDATPWTTVYDVVTLDQAGGLATGFGLPGVQRIESLDQFTAAGARRFIDATGPFGALLFGDDTFDTPGITNELPANIRVTPSDLNLTEKTTTDANGIVGVTTRTFDVTLDSQPGSNVTIFVSPDGQVEVNGGSATVQLNFTPSNWFTPQTVSVVAIDDAVDEGTHTGTITLTSDSIDTDYDEVTIGVSATIVDNDAPQHVVVINEILYDPGTQVDANNSGAVDPEDDEFVEVLNTGSTPIDISGWTIEDSFALRHTFGAGTVLAAGQAIVVFGAGSVGPFGNSLFTDASTGGLSLSNGGDTVTLFDGTLIVDQYQYADGEVNDESLARDPDGTGPFVGTFSGIDFNEGPNFEPLFATPGRTNFEANLFDIGASVLIVESDGSTDVAEAGLTSDTFTVALGAQPTGTVTVALASTGSDVTLSTMSLTFTSINWATPQTVTVTAADDTDIEGLHTDLITFTVTNPGGDYDALLVPGVTVNVTDDDLPVSTLSPGDLVINEIMQNPVAADDSVGEYVELWNTTGADIDINGFILRDDGTDSHTIAAANGPTIVPAGGYLVLASSSDPLVNGGITGAYQYATFQLGNGADEVIIEDTAGLIIDQVFYDGGTTFPDPTGASMELIPGLTDPHLANDAGANWRAGTATFGAGDLGTPGAVNSDVVTAPAPTVVSVTINEGAAFANSRSMVTSLTIEFDSLLDPAALANAFTITNITTGQVVDTVIVAATDGPTATTVTLTFGDGGVSVVNRMGTGLLDNSLANGNYQLDISSTNVVLAGGTVAMQEDFGFGGQLRTDADNDNFFRLYGEATGDGLRDGLDLNEIIPTLFNAVNYRSDLDVNGDGLIDGIDLNALIPTLFGSSRP